jgi:hypothetical protein
VVRSSLIALYLSLIGFPLAVAQEIAGPPVPPQLMPRRALDVEKRRIVAARRFPSRIITGDVLVAGGGTGGVAAAEALARRGRSVVLVEPTRVLGGQFTAQCVPVPDENSYIERDPGTGTRSYRALREEVRAWYAAQPGIRPGRERNVGQCWVSRVSGEPAVWEAAIRGRLQRLVGMGGLKAVLPRHQLIEVRNFAHSGQYHYADFVDLESDRVTRVAARYLLDATEMGDGILLAGLPWTVGAEGRETYGEPDAPETPRPDWIQSFTYCFLLRWVPEGPHTIVEKPEEYEAFKALGAYTLDYLYSDERGRVTYRVFERAPGTGGPFWTYRRLVAASSFAGNPAYATDLTLINWPGNDFHEENPIGKSLEEQVRILERGRAFAQGFLHWLQTECPRDDGGVGYPEMQLATDVEGTEGGFGLHPYIRESRRILAEVTLTENDLRADPAQPEKRTGTIFPDSVGIALYAIDIHPAKDEPPLLARALPYTLPLGALIARGGPENVLPAAKNFGGSRLALSSARMHPIEWLVGEVAGSLAAFCLERGVTPRQVRATSELLSAFQSRLVEDGITLTWEGVLQPVARSPQPVEQRGG